MSAKPQGQKGMYPSGVHGPTGGQRMKWGVGEVKLSREAYFKEEISRSWDCGSQTGLHQNGKTVILGLLPT